MKYKTRQFMFFGIIGAVLLSMANSVAAITPAEVAKLTAADGEAYVNFGWSVALDGDTAVIGAAYDDEIAHDSGAAYVFVRDANGHWREEAKLTASDGSALDKFGNSVALDGDTALIGAHHDDDIAQWGGAAYVFVRNGGIWSEQAKLIASDEAMHDVFGDAVAIDGDMALIGARGNGEEPWYPYSGSVYVFTRDGSGAWSEQQKFKASDWPSRGWYGGSFGNAIALDGDTAVIGSDSDDEFYYNGGSAYVFTRDAAGFWNEQAKLLPNDPWWSDKFGWTVSLSGDTAFIGAPVKDDMGSDSGAVYVFTRSGSTWTQQAKLLASDGAPSDRFGWPVALEGDTAVIGASRWYTSPFPGDTELSSAYVFVRNSAGVWEERAQLAASDIAIQDWFGHAVALQGGTVVIGSPSDDDHGTSSGSAYVFSLVTDDEGPLSSNVIAMPNPVEVNTAITLTANVDDSTTGGSNIASAAYTVDESPAVAMMAQNGDFDEVSEDVTVVLPAFAESAVHSLCVSGTDSAGNTGDEECLFLAIYDPDGGFVTGGGWIDSPAGAYVADPTLTGKAKFGFVSKYKKGQQTPSGNTEFQFKTANLNFHSTSYEWLVVAHHKAQYKGEGTINGTGSYGFVLFAIDANLTPSTDVDLFRIKIWDKDNGDAVVYDNELGDSEYADPTTAIGGGSIVIHKKD